MDARRAFLERLIDYAGLFPPARLPMDGAVAGYLHAGNDLNRWVLDRFICPASRLEELASALTGWQHSGREPWRISLVMDAAAADWPDGLTSDIDKARTFHERTRPAALIELVEMPLPRPLVEDDRLGLEVGAVLARLGSTGIPALPFFEVPFGDRWEESMPRALAGLAAARQDVGHGLGAKVRCGGLTADAFPSPQQVARFITACRDLELPMKATAGLHHPFRHRDPETGFTHHGFVNLMGAAILAHAHGLDTEALSREIADEDTGDFGLTAQAFRWRHLEVTAGGISQARRRLFVGYGSCSFREPVEDLMALGILPLEEVA
ncbi:MAG: hypothetical protein ACE5KX_00330 [Acidimicrobiia bacterium]